MKRITLLAGAGALVIGIAPGATLAQQPQGPQPFFVGNPSRPARRAGRRRQPSRRSRRT